MGELPALRFPQAAAANESSQRQFLGQQASFPCLSYWFPNSKPLRKKITFFWGHAED